MTGLDGAVAFTVRQEGSELDLTPSDPGNWTGGAVGRGSLRGSRFGISSASHPGVNVRTLTLAGARAIYRSHYWQPIAGDALPPGLEVLLFDSSVHHGWPRAVRWLQAAIGASERGGQVGPVTLAALNSAIEREGAAVIAAKVLSAREAFLRASPAWRRFGRGWARRLCALRQQLGRMPEEQAQRLSALAPGRAAWTPERWADNGSH
jgi:lysozyme family protein